ncbi:hypothetical protein [Streptomyces afghaniensis]|uniref:hypothetical protein n=1 Tax=Streptomyces afghaniensis TaxID=66865 RepID=UPI0027836967|nr:hypothetical protein [Streptomyces afghaniensis]MDQ1018109.1 hypothetical protein [Streptomyces afghaniensis]
MDWLMERRLRALCKRELRALGVRSPLRVDELCRLLGEARGRPLRLMPYPLEVPGPYGAWVSTPTADYIFFQKETTKTHQDHIILHEIGHMLAGHHNESIDDLVVSEQAPDLPPSTIDRALRRTLYDNAQEREAETIATIIMEWTVCDGAAPLPARDVAPTDVRSALGDRRRFL